MSLINQALKMEQQRRQAQNGPLPPMASRAFAARGRERGPMLLFGFTAMGALLALSVTVIFYFGSAYLKAPSQVAQDESSTEAKASAAAAVAAPPTDGSLPSSLETLSDEQLATVQQMLRDREAATEEPPEQAAPPQAQPAVAQERLARKASIQGIVDGYSVQGIRKAGADTRVFLNGKIQRLGDVLDIERGIRLIGFTDHALVFEDAAGDRYQKRL